MDDKYYIDQLYPHRNVFQNSKENILNAWTSFEPIEEIFRKHSIDKRHFLEKFASGVFDYFMSVIAEEVVIGQCPVMEQFLLFLKDVDISSQELFEICTHFKRAMIDFTYVKQINSQDIFNAITHIFDQNFSAILKFYSDTIYAKEQEIIKNMELLAEYKKAIDESSLVYKLGADKRINYVNEKLLELSGYEIDEIIGAPYDFLRYDKPEREQCVKIWEDIELNGIYRGIVKNRKKDGSYFYLQVTMLKLYNPHEEETEYMVIAYDVTTLIDARIEATKASEAKEYFLSNMSHEIRTPLNAILGFVSLLLDEEKDAVHKKYLEIIAKSGENLLGIINDILDFSKIRSGEFVIEKREFLLYEEIQNVLDLFRASALSKDIEIIANFQEDMPTLLFGDILRIKQIISNFMSNAIKFTDNGGRIMFDVSFDDGELDIAVTDNGIGIKKENLQNIFHAFTQVEHNATLYGGTGLGLSISYQLAKQMGGSVDVESIYGLGSKFGVYIPVEIVDEEVSDLRQQKEDKKAFEQIRFVGKILIADDNEANRELIKVFLSKFGLECDVASDGLEALQFFSRNKYDLILMDEQMPNMDGREAVEKIREYEKLHNLERTPISAITANVIKGAKEYTLEHGFDDFLGKPIELIEFQRVLKKYLKSAVYQKELHKHSNESVDRSSLQIKGIDKENLLEELALSEDELRMLLELFLKKRDALLTELENAINKRDMPHIAKIAHNIKGSSGNFRLEEIQKVASQIEQMAKELHEDFDYEAAFDILAKKYKAIEIL